MEDIASGNNHDFSYDSKIISIGKAESLLLTNHIILLIYFKDLDRDKDPTMAKQS